MFRNLLFSSLVMIHLNCGSALVTMSPALAKIVPANLPPLREEFIVCFNKYWDIKERLDAKLRQEWNCTSGCSKGPECCIAYKVWDSLSTLKMPECDSGAQNMIRMFLPIALNQIQDRCEPEFKHGSTECLVIERKFVAVTSDDQGTCARKVCACY